MNTLHGGEPYVFWFTALIARGFLRHSPRRPPESTALHLVRILPFHPVRYRTDLSPKGYSDPFASERHCSHLSPCGGPLLADTFLTNSFLKIDRAQKEIGRCPDFPHTCFALLSIADLRGFELLTRINADLRLSAWSSLICVYQRCRTL